MNINDILGLGKVLPIDKLIDIVSSVTGRLSKSYFDRKDIDTKVYEIKKLAEARAEEMKTISKAVKENFLLTGGIEYKENTIAISSPKELPKESHSLELLTAATLEDRAKERINFQEAKKQLNIESVTSYAAEQLRNQPPVTDEPLDEDWKTRFFNIAEDISSDEMQALWGRILAGEIKQPKSYSLRTLELLRNLSKTEAECFLKFGQLAITSLNNSFILNFKDEKLLEETYKLNFSERLLLEELGLITANDLQFELRANPEQDRQSVFRIGSVCIVATRKKGTPQQDLQVLVFTKIGQELLQLIETIPQLDYIQLLASKIRREGVMIKYANILKIDNDEINHTELIDVPLTEVEIRQEEEKRKQEANKLTN
jgi:uncharacterized repeat protein (TIGR03899 family)